MTRVFVFANHKRCVGKSTSAATTAPEIAGMLRGAGASNADVLLIDTDSQAHATLVTTCTKDYGTDDSLYTVLMAHRQTPRRLSSIASCNRHGMRISMCCPLPRCSKGQLAEESRT